MKVVYINPTPKPRMTQRDKWKGRPVVKKYYYYKDSLVWLTRQQGIKLGDEINVVFRIPMPKSWGAKMRLAMNGKPHQSKPDIDNLVKALMDALLLNDQSVYSVNVKKYWSTEGSIEFH